MLLDNNSEIKSQEISNKNWSYRIGFIAGFSLEVYILFESPLKSSVNKGLISAAHEFRDVFHVSDQASQHLVGISYSLLCLILAHYLGKFAMKLGNK